MKRLPTDLHILNVIYDRYYATFAQFEDGDASRDSKILVPIDIKQIAEDLNVDDDIIFGRLYYHLEKKHGYRNDDGSIVAFFTRDIPGHAHCVNFPLVASVLGDLRDRARKHYLATWLAVGSLIISIVAIVIAVLGD